MFLPTNFPEEPIKKRMSGSPATLYYIHDPMCSWCWGFVPVWEQVQTWLNEQMSDEVKIRYVLGGLAPDSDQPMPADMQASIRSNWLRIQQTIACISFNYGFWAVCRPRRSTYPSCRAIIACNMQRPELKHQMLLAIQQAYYLYAKNPSDTSVLIKLAEDIGLDGEVFSSDLNSEACNEQLENELLLTRELGVSSFPSLVLSKDDLFMDIPIDYQSSKNILRLICLHLEGGTRR